MSEVTAHFSGGPVNGQYRTIEDSAEYHVPMVPASAVLNPGQFNLTRVMHASHRAVYRRMRSISPGVVQFDYVGVECPKDDELRAAVRANVAALWRLSLSTNVPALGILAEDLQRALDDA